MSDNAYHCIFIALDRGQSEIKIKLNCLYSITTSSHLSVARGTRGRATEKEVATTMSKLGKTHTIHKNAYWAPWTRYDLAVPRIGPATTNNSSPLSTLKGKQQDHTAK